jgi:hypothetical protein
MYPAAFRPELSPDREGTLPRRPRDKRLDTVLHAAAKSIVVKLQRRTFDTWKFADGPKCHDRAGRELRFRAGSMAGGGGDRVSSDECRPGSRCGRSFERCRIRMTGLRTRCARAGGPSSTLLGPVVSLPPSSSELLRNDGRALASWTPEVQTKVGRRRSSRSAMRRCTMAWDNFI